MSESDKRLKDGCGWVEVSDGWRGVGKRLLDGFGEMVVRRLWLSGGWLRPCRGWEMVV